MKNQSNRDYAQSRTERRSMLGGDGADVSPGLYESQPDQGKGRAIYTEHVVPSPHSRLRIAAIRFLNPAPLMWDFKHGPLRAELAERYEIDWMLPSECADRLS